MQKKKITRNFKSTFKVKYNTYPSSWRVQQQTNEKQQDFRTFVPVAWAE